MQTRVKKDKLTLNTVWQRKHKWLGHVLRHEVLLGHNRTKNEWQGDKRYKVTSRWQQDTWRSSELQKIGVCGVQGDVCGVQGDVCGVQGDEGNQSFTQQKTRRRRCVYLSMFSVLLWWNEHTHACHTHTHTHTPYRDIQGAAKKMYHDKNLILSQTDGKFKTKVSTLITDIYAHILIKYY